MKKAPVIEIKNVTFSYNESNKIIEKASLEVFENDFIGVIGPNGGGKTTLLKLILGLLKPSSGSIKVLQTLPEKARIHIGYVPQFRSFSKNFPITVENTVLMGRLCKTSLFCNYSYKDKKIVNDILKKLNILDLKNLSIGSLSGGQLQKVLIARALSSKPKILLLDEPSASTDPHSEENLFDILKNLQKEITILLVSHDIGFISHYITRVACINKKLVCHKTEKITTQNLKNIYDHSIHIIPHHKIEKGK